MPKGRNRGNWKIKHSAMFRRLTGQESISRPATRGGKMASFIFLFCNVSDTNKLNHLYSQLAADMCDVCPCLLRVPGAALMNLFTPFADTWIYRVLSLTHIFRHGPSPTHPGSHSRATRIQAADPVSLLTSPCS